MKLFACDNCQQTLYFENSRCVNCGESVGYCPEVAHLAVLRQPADAPPGIFEISLPNNETRRDRQCGNARFDACNWLVTTDSAAEYCRSCELSEVIPDLSDPANELAWRHIEAAKRRLVYTLLSLKLPVAPKKQYPETGIAFHFLRGTNEEPAMTGHEDGVITLNIAEADSTFRENMREKMGEAYRTVLGHFRHEVGHYYWDRLIPGTEWEEPFRALFGDERADYAAALKANYESGPPPDWRDRHISAYASSHPWEDWAETWAHFMHIQDSLDTAISFGIKGDRMADKVEPYSKEDLYAPDDPDAERVLVLLNAWLGMTTVLNELARSMGQPDFYPFVMSRPVVRKLHFIQLVCRQGPAAA